MTTSTCVTEKYGCGKLLFRKKYLKRKIYKIFSKS